MYNNFIIDIYETDKYNITIIFIYNRDFSKNYIENLPKEIGKLINLTSL